MTAPLSVLKPDMMCAKTIMHWAIRSFNIHPLSNPLNIWTFEDWFIQIIPPSLPMVKIRFNSLLIQAQFFP